MELLLQQGMAIKSRYVITCCGLYADRVAQLSGCKPEPKVVPFRGEYLLLSPSKTHLVNGNIYPVSASVLGNSRDTHVSYKQVPNPKFPFLGVHFTPRMDGSVWCGPNAVLAFSREGYTYSNFSWTDFKEILTFKLEQVFISCSAVIMFDSHTTCRGLRTLACRHWRFGSSELYRSIVMRAQLKRLQKYIPSITMADISR